MERPARARPLDRPRPPRRTSPPGHRPTGRGRGTDPAGQAAVRSRAVRRERRAYSPPMFESPSVGRRRPSGTVRIPVGARTHASTEVGSASSPAPDSGPHQPRALRDSDVIGTHGIAGSSGCDGDDRVHRPPDPDRPAGDLLLACHEPRARVDAHRRRSRPPRRSVSPTGRPVGVGVAGAWTSGVGPITPLPHGLTNATIAARATIRTIEGRIGLP